MFSQPTSHGLDTSEFNVWCRTTHFIHCDPEKLKIGYPLFQPSCISVGDRMSLLDRFIVRHKPEPREARRLAQGHTLLIIHHCFAPCPALVGQNGPCYVSRDGTCWVDASWETDDWARFHTRCWEPYTNPYLSVVAPPHRDWYNQTCALPAGERVYLREYTFRWDDAWTIPSHSPLPKQCLQPW